MTWPWRHRTENNDSAIVTADDVDEQSLILEGTQLVHWEVDGDELALDLWGGTGSWLGFKDGAVAVTGQVNQPPAFTVKAHLSTLLDLDLLSRLDRMTTASGLLTVRIDALGAGLLEHPVRLELTDGVEELRVDALA